MPVLRDLLSFERRAISRADWARGADVTVRETASGAEVTDLTAMQVSAVYACVRLLSETIGSLPVHLVRKRGRGRERLDDHPLVPLLAHSPNLEIDAGELWRATVGWMCFRGNAYQAIERDGSGRPIGLWPLPADRVTLGRDRNGELAYRVDLEHGERVAAQVNAATLTLPARDVLHFRAFGTGLTGLSPLTMARESVGVALQAREYAARFYQNDASPGGFLATDEELDDEKFDRLNKQWKDAHQGAKRAHMMALLEGGVRWEQVGISPQDAEFINTQKWQTTEIARVFGVPPHMIGDVERSTSWGSGIEAQGIGFVQYVLRPWVVRLESVVRRQLLRPSPLRQSDVKAVWSMDALLRGDVATRHQAYVHGRQWGWYSANDIRELEDLEPIDGGDVYLQPLNMVPAGTVVEPQPGTRHADGTWEQRVGPLERRQREWEDRLSSRLARLFGEQETDVAAAIAGAASPAEALDPDRWNPRLSRILLDHARDLAAEFGSRVAEQFGAEFDLPEDWLEDNADIAAENINATTREQLANPLDGDEGPSETVRRVFQVAASSRAGQIAVSRVTTVGNYARMSAAGQARATHKTWRTTSGNPRSEHAAMDGETVEIGERFSNGLMWPGDPSGDVDEVAGCQCEVEFTREGD